MDGGNLGSNFQETVHARRQWSVEKWRRGRLSSILKCFHINIVALNPVLPWTIIDAVNRPTIFQWMGWRRAASVFLSCVSIASKPPIKIPSTSSTTPHFLHSSNQVFGFQCSRLFSAVASPFSITGSQFESEFEQSYDFEVEEGDEIGKIPIKAYFLCTRFVIQCAMD